MNAKTAVKLLRGSQLRSTQVGVVASLSQAEVLSIASFIERKFSICSTCDRDCKFDTDNNSECKSYVNHQAQYAQLGILAMEISHCYWGYKYGDGDCRGVKCSSYKLCRLRAELLAEVQK